MTPPGLKLERDGPVATVTLCRPDVLNAQTPQTWQRLREVARELTGEVRVVVVRGAGRAFSAGLDRTAAAGLGAELAALPESEAVARIAEFQEAFSWLRNPSVVTIAAVQGAAVGAGLQLALACDFRVLAEDARLAMAEIKLGLVPDLGGTKRLLELVGYARALELCLTARTLSADEAYRIGLATLVAPAGDLDASVADLTAAVLAADRNAVTEIKGLLSGAAVRSYPEQARAEREAQVRRLQELFARDEPDQ